MYVHRKISALLIGVSLSGTSWCVLSMDRSLCLLGSHVTSCQ